MAQALKFQDVKVDPNSGQIVTGKESSILVREGEITKAEKTFKGTIYEDTNTGNVLVVTGKSGGFYEYTETGQHWTYYRGWDARGSYMLSRVKDFASLIGGEEFGVNFTQTAGDTIGGIDDITSVIKNIKGVKKLWPTNKAPTTYQPDRSKAEPSKVLAPDGKTPASEYQSFGGGPRERIILEQ